MFERLYAEQTAALAAKTPQAITMTLPDGSAKAAEAWRTTPYDIAASISNGLAQACVIAKVRRHVFSLRVWMCVCMCVYVCMCVCMYICAGVF